MNNIQIQLNQLTAWAGNVRKTQNDAGLAELAASIQAVGLLQPVIVQQEASGAYSVVAGRRRFMALTMLVDKGVIPVDYAVPAMVIPTDADRTEISLVENVVREPMHPADEFEAFKALVDAGSTITDVAARFGVSETVVKKRLTLADVSPVIFQAYRDGKLELSEIQAYAATTDHVRQETFFEQQGGSPHPNYIRRMMTEGEIGASDQRVKYVTIEAYEQAGGAVRRDLFAESRDSAYILDVDLLNKMVSEKLEQDAEAVKGEGWKWVEVIAELSYNDTANMTQIEAELAPLTAELEAEAERLNAEYKALYDGEDEFTDEQSERIDAIDERLEEIEESRAEIWSPNVLKKAGAIVSKGQITRGLVKKADKKSVASDNEDGATDAPAEKQKDENALSSNLIHDLTSHKSAALSAALASRPDVALAATVYTLVSSKIHVGAGADVPVKVNVAYTGLSPAVGEKGISKGKAELEKLGKALKKKIPSGKKLWPWCLEQDTPTLLEALAFCVAQGVDTVAHHMTNTDKGKELAEAVGLDMADWFKPTADNYFSRISKPQLLAAIEEMTVEPVSPSVEKMKKGDLAKHAEKCAKEAATPYVPPILRIAK